MDLKPLKKKSSNLNLTLGETHVTEKHKLEPVINNNWSVESLKKHVTSMSSNQSLKYSHVIMVSR